MILSQTAVYALRATLCLAESQPPGRLRVDDIASELDMPRNYLSKILHVLAREGLLLSIRGPGGGFELARPAVELSVAEVVRPFDGLPEESGCLLGREQCSDRDPCAAHDRWKGAARSLQDFFTKTSIADLASRRTLAKARGLA